MPDRTGVASTTMRSDGTGTLATGKRTSLIIKQVKKTWFDILFVDDDGRPVPSVEFDIIFADGTTKSATADGNGYYKDEETPEGQVRVLLKDGSIIEACGNDDDAVRDDENPDNNSEELIEYLIRRGDTLSKIARRFGTGWRKLYRAKGPDGKKNSERLRSGNPNLIYPGETIWVPTRRRVVRIHTDNAAASATRVRIRKKRRTQEQQRAAQIQEVYNRRLQHKSVDNLALAVGWDDGQGTLNVEDLCGEISAVLKVLMGSKFAQNWNLYVIQRTTMTYYDNEGNFQDKFKLSQAPLGLVGAYMPFEINGRTPTRALYDHSQGLGAKVGGREIGVAELIVGEDSQKKYLDSIVEIDEKRKLINFKKLPVFYQVPVSREEWAGIVWLAGNGMLDNYLGDSGYDKTAHKRNLSVLENYNAVYRGQLARYINRLKAIPPETGEDALRELGPPPEPYRFPMPVGADSDKRQKLLGAMAEISSYQAWLAISEKIFDIQNHRWPTTAARHQEGSIFFRAKFTLEPSIEEKINSLADQYLFGHLSSYKTVKLEWNFDAGSDGIKQGSSRSVTFKEDGLLKIKKFEIGAGREVEIDESGGKKVTVKGSFMGYGVEASTDGEMKMTGPRFATSSWNEKTAEGGMGLSIPIPGVGSIYIGINFVLIKAETLLVFLTGAPGFFERKSCDTLVKTYWKNLTYQEKGKLELLGWKPDMWDIKDRVPPAMLPDTVRNLFEAMSYEQQIAAMHLGFQDLYRDNWENFWKKLPPVEE